MADSEGTPIEVSFDEAGNAWTFEHGPYRIESFAESLAGPPGMRTALWWLVLSGLVPIGRV